MNPESFVRSLVLVGMSEESAFAFSAELMTLFWTGFSDVELSAESIVMPASEPSLTCAVVVPFLSVIVIVAVSPDFVTVAVGL